MKTDRRQMLAAIAAAPFVMMESRLTSPKDGDALVSIYLLNFGDREPDQSFLEQVRMHQIKKGQWFLRIQDENVQQCYAEQDPFLDPVTEKWTILARPLKPVDHRSEPGSD